MNFNIRKTNNELLASIPPGQSNSSASTLILFGKHFANYGPVLNENLVHLMEHFSNPTPPPNPTEGQLWWNSVTNIMSVWDGTKWELLNATALRGIAEALVKNRVYVAKSGDDNNSGLSWLSAKRTIKAACAKARQMILTDQYEEGHVVVLVAAGDYTEDCPITVPEGVSIVGDDLRSVTVRPRQVTNNVFLLNSKNYVYGLTVRGHQLSPSALDITPEGYAGASGQYLPRNTLQTGFAFSFAPGAIIKVSPYIQNCSSISGDPGSGSGISPGGGGVLVDPSVCGQGNRINSIVVDAFTQINLGGIGVKVVGKGYMQLVSFYINFCQFGLLCVDGGHVTALNSNCSFGHYSMWSEGSRWLDSPGTVDTVWTGDGSSEEFLTPAGSQILPGQEPDIVLSVTPQGGTETQQIYGVDFVVENNDAWPNQTKFIFLDSSNLPPAGSQIRARVRFGSLIEASGYTMTYTGAGLDYNSLSPSQGGSGASDPNKYTTKLDHGNIFHTTTDERGDFYVGYVNSGNYYEPTSVSVNNGGSNYAVDDLISISGEGWNSPLIIKVTSVSGGIVTAISLLEYGSYSGPKPSSVLNQTETSGAGTGATFDVSWSDLQSGSARPNFRINQRRGAIDGRSFYQSIFGFMAPFVLALTRKGS